MKVIACYKIVPDEQSLRASSDGSIDLSTAELVIGQYDLNAVEAGAQLVEKCGGELVALSVGSSEVENSKLRKGILSRGSSSCVVVNNTALSGADSITTSAALANAVGTIGEFDLIICGEGSADLYAQQVGVQLGARLGLPTVNGVINIVPDDGFITVQRSADNEIETLRVELPAVISVSSSISKPRIPGMKDILAAGKKPFTVLGDESITAISNAATVTESLLAPKQAARACQIFTGDDADTVAAFAAAIGAELK